MAALEMVQGVATHGLPPAHVGLHAGPVVFQEGDYFGRTVNIAARIAEYARPGEVLVSQEVVHAAEGGPVTFTGIGPVELKGVPGTLRLYIAPPRRLNAQYRAVEASNVLTERRASVTHLALGLSENRVVIVGSPTSAAQRRL